MVILKNFPPSSSIQEGIRLPTIKITRIKTGKLKKEQKFRHMRAEFFVIGFQRHASKRELRALCYKGSKAGASSAGNIYVFDNNVEVDAFEEVWS